MGSRSLCNVAPVLSGCGWVDRGGREGGREGGGRGKKILTTNERSTANHNYYTCSATASECMVV